MTKTEILERLSQEGLKNILCDGHEIEFIDGKEVFHDNTFHSRPNVFGVYHDCRIDKHVFFVTGSERGTLYYKSKHDTEDEAYSALYEFIVITHHAFNK